MKPETQYRIIESRSGESFDPFYEVEYREKEPGLFLTFWKTWGKWRTEPVPHGHGNSGLRSCKTWIKDQQAKKPEYYYSGRVVYTEDTASLSDGAQFLQAANPQPEPRWVDPA